MDDFVRSTVTPKLGNILTSSQLFVLGIKVYALPVLKRKTEKKLSKVALQGIVKIKNLFTSSENSSRAFVEVDSLEG